MMIDERWQRRRHALIRSHDQGRDKVGRDEGMSGGRWRSLQAALRKEYSVARKARPDRTARRLRRLTRTDVDVLELALRYQTQPVVESMIDDVFRSSRRFTPLNVQNPALSALLGVSANTGQGRLRGDAPLVRSGLVCVDGDGDLKAFDRLNRLAAAPAGSGLDVHRLLLDAAPASELEWSDFEHVAHDRNHIERVIKGALQSGDPGVNILLYGAPGTGKTEFCKTLAERLDVSLYSVGESDDGGDEPVKLFVPCGAPHSRINFTLGLRDVPERTNLDMTFAQLLAFNIALLVAIASPGPALLMAIKTTLSGGRRAGVAAGAGLGLMAATWTLMALLGLGVVFELFPTVYVAARVAGAGYLLYLAYRIWRDASVPIEARGEPARHAFRQGFLINLLNPKSVLFAAAVLVAVFPAGIGVVDSLVIVVNHFLAEVAFYTTLAFCLSTVVVARRYMQARAYIDRFAAAVLGALGFRLLWNRGEVPQVVHE